MLKLIYLLSPVQLHALVWTKCVRELVAIAWCAIIMPQSLRCISLIVFWIVKLYNYSVITSTGTMRCYKNIDYTIVLQCYLSCYIPIILSRLPSNTTWHSVVQTIASHGLLTRLHIVSIVITLRNLQLLYCWHHEVSSHPKYRSIMFIIVITCILSVYIFCTIYVLPICIYI